MNLHFVSKHTVILIVAFIIAFSGGWIILKRCYIDFIDPLKLALPAP